MIRAFHQAPAETEQRDMLILGFTSDEFEELAKGEIVIQPRGHEKGPMVAIFVGPESDLEEIGKVMAEAGWEFRPAGGTG